MISYPGRCLRGIPNDNDLIEGGVATHLFYFKKEFARPDGWTEQSINWEDNESARTFTLNQRKEDGQFQFRAGIAVIERTAIDNIKNLPALKNTLSYERSVLPGNAYHGNLLLVTNTPPLRMKQIAAALALHVSEIISQL